MLSCTNSYHLHYFYYLLFSSVSLGIYSKGWHLSLLPISLSYLLFSTFWLFFVLLLYDCSSFTSCVFFFLSSTFSFFSHFSFLCLLHCFLRVRFLSVVHSFWNICLPTFSFLQSAFINLRFSIKRISPLGKKHFKYYSLFIFMCILFI